MKSIVGTHELLDCITHAIMTNNVNKIEVSPETNQVQVTMTVTPLLVQTLIGSATVQPKKKWKPNEK